MYELIKSFEQPQAHIYHGDCIEIMRCTREAAGGGCYDLVFGDPPFNIGVEYEGKVDDRRSLDEYEQFTFDWMHAACCLLKPAGRLVVHVPDECLEAVFLARRRIGITRTQHIVWHYRFGQSCKSRFVPSKCHQLVFQHTRDDEIWGYDDLLVPCDRARKYNDKRTLETAEPGMRLPFDVWGADVDTFADYELPGDGEYWARVMGSSLERRSLHPNQLPERLLERNLRAYTRAGSWVFDPFGGSGTTITVARAMNRNCVTCDQSIEYCKSIADRVARGSVRIKEHKGADHEHNNQLAS